MEWSLVIRNFTSWSHQAWLAVSVLRQLTSRPTSCVMYCTSTASPRGLRASQSVGSGGGHMTNFTTNPQGSSDDPFEASLAI